MHEGERIALAVPVAVLGRVASCDVKITHPLVSRRHCSVEATADGIFVEDLGSSNGTYVNGGRAAGRVRMCIGDVLRIGQEGPEFRLLSGAYDGRDVATLDPEAMEKTMMAGDPRLADLAAKIRVSPGAAPGAPATEEAPTRESAASLADDEPPTRAVGDGVTTGSIPVAVPMDQTGEQRAARKPAADPEPATQQIEAPRPARAVEPSPPTAESEPAPTTEVILEQATHGFVPGFLLGLLLGVIAAAAAAVFTPWGDSLAGWPDAAQEESR